MLRVLLRYKRGGVMRRVDDDLLQTGLECLCVERHVFGEYGAGLVAA